MEKETLYDKAKKELKEERYLVTVDKHHPYWRFLLEEWEEKGKWSPEFFERDRLVATATEVFRAMGRPAFVVYFFSAETPPDRAEPSFFLIGSDLIADLDRAAEWGAFL
jgi:hypothetical protein